MQRPRIVAIDGPAGSGKSSISSRVADRVGWTYVNTGAIYRAIGLLAVESGIDPADEEAVAAKVESWAAELRWDGGSGILLHGARDITTELGGESAGRGASQVARMPSVREKLLSIQRQWALAAKSGALVDGRDIGTVVFPDADLKIFLTASLEERARRRMAQTEADLGDSGEAERIFEAIRSDIARRDERDSARKTAPLKRADDAVEIDTSDMSLDEVVATIVGLLEKRGLL